MIMELDTLFVTTSTQKMYDANGKNLTESFIQFCNMNNSKLLYCTENFNIDITNDKILSAEISDYSFLTQWQNKFKSYIPYEFGGCYDIKNTPKVHIPLHSARYKASLWFRKIVSLHYAYTNFKFKQLIWIDNDCILTSNITNELLDQLFITKDAFICYGDFRKKSVVGVETGFFGIKNNFSLLQDLFDAYTTGEFINTINWGDGHVLAHIIHKNETKYSINDLGSGIYEQHIMNFIPILKTFIVHKKGFYRKNDIDYVRSQ